MSEAKQGCTVGEELQPKALFSKSRQRLVGLLELLQSQAFFGSFSRPASAMQAVLSATSPRNGWSLGQRDSG